MGLTGVLLLITLQAQGRMGGVFCRHGGDPPFALDGRGKDSLSWGFTGRWASKGVAA